MLIISIPKSVNTSLLKTLSRLHQTEGHQFIYKDYVIPDSYQLTGKYHGDLRKYNPSDIGIFPDTKKIYKQHIPPIDNNLDLLRDKKKVILLSEPREIIMAYYRADKKWLHEKRQEFKNANTAEDWRRTLSEIGLLGELEDFYNKWMIIEDEKLVIQSEDSINDPQKTINSIEAYFDLKETIRRIVFVKERYSRGKWIYYTQSYQKIYV